MLSFGILQKITIELREHFHRNDFLVCERTEKSLVVFFDKKYLEFKIEGFSHLLEDEIYLEHYIKEMEEHISIVGFKEEIGNEETRN